MDRFQPYYLTEKEQQGELIKKLNLFTSNEVTLYKVKYGGRPSRNIKGWETEINPTLSYVYDRKLRFGALHREVVASGSDRKLTPREQSLG